MKHARLGLQDFETRWLALYAAKPITELCGLPSNAISNTVRNAMLERGLVTAQRLRERGVL